MTIIRAIHDKENPYVMVNRYICEDDRISWKAKGIWLYAFSRKDDWKFNLKDLINRSKDSRDSVRSGLEELENHGYLYRPDTNRDDLGRFNGRDWYFFETPKTLVEIQKMFTESENANSEKTNSENRPLIINDLNKEEENNNVVVVFPALDQLNLTSTDQITISKKLADEEQAALLVKRIKNWHSRQSDAKAAYTILSRWDHWSDELTAEEKQRQEEIEMKKLDKLVEKRKDQVETTKKTFPESGLRIYSDRAEIRIGNGYQICGYRDDLFDSWLEQVKDYLKKTGD